MLNQRLYQTLLILVILAIIQSCSAHTGTYFIPEESLHSQVKILAIGEVEFDYDESDAEVASEVKKVTESLIVNKLNELGNFKIITPEVVATTRKTIMEELGIEGFHSMNPDTGVVSFDAEKAKKVNQALKDRLNVDAILSPKYVIRDAKIKMGGAKWDGVSAGTKTTGSVIKDGLKNYLGNVVAKSSAPTALITTGTTTVLGGNVPAISLETKISDGEKTLWVGYGGVGILTKETALGEKQLTSKQIYFNNKDDNTERIDKAVKLAFSSLK